MMLGWMGVMGVMFFFYFQCDMLRIRDQRAKAAKEKEEEEKGGDGGGEDDRAAPLALCVETSQPQPQPETGCQYDYKKFLQYFVLGSLNLFIVITVNGAYVYSSYQNLSTTTTLWIQIGLAVFKLLYNKCVPVLTIMIRDVKINIAVRSLLHMFNNLLIPCVAVAFTSPACYQVVLASTGETTRIPQS
jgi:hypothetical protein